MKPLSHLQIEEVKLPPGNEWTDTTDVWRFLLVSRGAAYWMGVGKPRSLVEGEMLILPPGAKSIVRASQINEVLLHGFNFKPDLLFGFFTLAERHFFESGAGSKPDEIQFLPSTHPVTQRFAAIIGYGTKYQNLSARAEVLGLVAAVFGEKTALHRPPPKLSTSALPRFQQLITKMPDMEIINHTPDQLARLCGCSPRHFNRLFHRHFGVSVRTRQTELRLFKSCQLLSNTDEKIIEVALESGYRNLSLFNSLFKKRFGMTPSDWRRKSTKKNGRIGRLAAGAAALLLGAAVSLHAGGTNANDQAIGRARIALHHRMEELDSQGSGIQTNASSAVVKTNEPTFEVRGYELLGNTLLPASVTEPILDSHTNSAVTFDEIRGALAELQMAYRERGFITVAVGLPQQQLTNGIVKIQITEGRLTEITVRGNHYYSSNNVMRALPCLRTNTLLNSLVFQQELDRANANRDRQIYPVISPGIEPGTSDLELKINDRLPLHARYELNNNSTPQSPELRMNFAAQYNNLWQLDHQFGVQYSFTPEEMKYIGYDCYDQPLVSSYSAFYRMPLSGVNGPQRQGDYTVGSFGYDEATRRFRPPPSTGTSEIIFYASRSFSDTGASLQQETLTPALVPPAGTLQVIDQVFTETLNRNEDVGMRLVKPLPTIMGFNSTLSAGFDFKNYRNTSAQVRVFQGILYIPEYGDTGPPFVAFPSPPQFVGQQTFNSVQYLPLSLGLNVSRPDKYGTTVFDLGSSFQPANVLGKSEDFQSATMNKKSNGRFYVVTAGLTRERTIIDDWGVRVHADGQWANEPLLSNEQFGLGGQAGPRGYREGQTYGDTGWRIQFEPHSPYLNFGMVDGTVPMLVRFYTFADYGQRYLLGNGIVDDATGISVQPKIFTLASTGLGFNASIGEHVDFRFQFSVVLHDAPYVSDIRNSAPPTRSGDVRANFGVGIQF